MRLSIVSGIQLKPTHLSRCVVSFEEIRGVEDVGAGVESVAEITVGEEWHLYPSPIERGGVADCGVEGAVGRVDGRAGGDVRAAEEEEGT